MHKKVRAQYWLFDFYQMSEKHFNMPPGCQRDSISQWPGSFCILESSTLYQGKGKGAVPGQRQLLDAMQQTILCWRIQ